MSEPTDPPAQPTLTVTSHTEAAPEAPPMGAAQPNVPRLTSPTKALVLDAKGRTLEVRKLGPMDRLDLAVILGPERVQNPQVQGYCTVAFSVAKIDSDAIFPAANYNELRALVGRLADEGIEAVSAAFGLLNPEIDPAQGDEAAVVKNS